MTELTLTDVGYYDVAQTLGDPSTEEMAYGTSGSKGAPLSLHAISVSLKIKPMVVDDSSPQLKDDDSDTKRFENSEVDSNGLNHPTWTVKGVFDTAIEGHMKDYGRLIHMCKTKGYKKLGFTYNSSGRWSAGGAGLLGDQADILNYSHYGDREYDSETTKTVDYVNVRIVSLDFDQVIKDGTKIPYTLELMETDSWA